MQTRKNKQQCFLTFQRSMLLNFSCFETELIFLSILSFSLMFILFFFVNRVMHFVDPDQLWPAQCGLSRPRA